METQTVNIIWMFVTFVIHGFIWFIVGKTVQLQSDMRSQKKVCDEVTAMWKEGATELVDDMIKKIKAKDAIIKQQDKIINKLSK